MRTLYSSFRFLFDMGKTNVIIFRVSGEEREKILEDTRRNGYVFMSSYLRNLALNGNLILKIYDTLKRIENKNKIKFKEF